MAGLFSTLAFLAVILVLILAHELGHFFTAKATGVTVQEFGIFFPPRLFSIKRGGTTYSVNAIPLGGFVKLAGEEDPKMPGSLAGKSAGVRFLVLAAGSVMNLLLPIVLFSVAFMVPHDTLSEKIVVQEVAPGSPAENAGIRPGDTVLAMNNRLVESMVDLTRIRDLNLGKEISVTVRHSSGNSETVRLAPRWQPPEGQGAMGILIRAEDAKITRASEPFWRAVPMGATAAVETFTLFKNGLISMFVGTAPAEVTGPVGIAQMTGEVARAGFSPLLEFAAFLSINLGIINIFPLPALDGGRIAFVLLEWLRGGKRISPRAEGRVHLIGFILLLAFLIAVTFNDIMRIVSG